MLTFVVKKSTMKVSGVSIFREQVRKLRIIIRFWVTDHLPIP